MNQVSNTALQPVQLGASHKPADIPEHDPVWVQVRDWARGELKQARARLELRGLSEADTEFERGKVDVLRDLLALPIRGSIPVNLTQEHK